MAVAALAAEGGYAQRRAMQRADAHAAACLLQAQSEPPLAAGVVEGGAPGVVVTGVKGDGEGGLRVDLHGLRVREATQVGGWGCGWGCMMIYACMACDG